MSAYIGKLSLAAALVFVGGSVSPSQAAFCGVSIVTLGCFDTLQAGSIGNGGGKDGVMQFGVDVPVTSQMVPNTNAPIHADGTINPPYFNDVNGNNVPAGFVQVAPIKFGDMSSPPTLSGIFSGFSTVASLVINGLNSLTGGFNQLVFSYLGQDNGPTGSNSGNNITFVVAKGADTYNVGDILGQKSDLSNNKTPITETFSFAQFAAAQTLTIYALSNDNGFSQAHFGAISAVNTAPAPIPGAGFLSFLALGLAKLRRRLAAMLGDRKAAFG